LTDALASLDTPIVVVLDDIDRLTTTEIRDVFKLIRLTANFPNVIYLAAFDRRRVEDALGEHRISGRDYLEKILQVAIDLPAVPPEVLNRQVIAAIDGAISGLDPEPRFSEQAWPDAYMEIIRPLLRNMRDVRRYAAAIHGTATGLGDQVELVDVLALEAVRVFLPDVFAALPACVDGLTTARSDYGRDDGRLAVQVQRLIETAGEQPDVVKAMIERLFPAAARHVGGMNYGGSFRRGWLRERRVAHEDILRLYLERVAGQGLQSFVDAEQAWVLLSDRDALDQHLRGVDRERLEDVIAALENYEDQFAASHVVPAVTVLLNLARDLPERHRGMFELDARIVVGRVVYRLLKALPDEAAVEAASRQILPGLSSLTAKLELVSDVGHREHRGHRLVSPEVATELERAWRAEVRQASFEALASEPDIFTTLYIASKEADADEPNLDVPADPTLTAAILKSARSESRSQPMGSRAVRRSPRLAWDALVELYGAEEVVRQRVEALKLAGLQDADEVVELAERYLSGWRPDQFGDRD
jgi:predicted KAP-like P-loop ATPase